MTIIRPKKSLGQHFLKDLTIAQRIAETLSAYCGLPVLEVGAGMGVLTRFLIAGNHNLSVVEIDKKASAYLRQNFPSLEGRIYTKDFLQMNLSEIYDAKFCVIGNYPYYISSQIFFKALEFRDQVVCCSGMIQKEVAERLAAKSGSGKTFGILSALIQPWFDVEYLFTVNENVFDPPPKVKSAVVRLTRNGRNDLGCDEAMYKKVVKTAFNQRRKTLRNSLKPLFGKDFRDCHLPVFDKRPEQISINQFIDLTLMAEKRTEERRNEGLTKETKFIIRNP
ncbi:MAG: 16S rRNA (adenine(1518)-N(6)/adenine(1519)-N(6))-dimethyltransferase RsmA [Tannerella sp.]|jgi:16S rRNA (adenine1518-N6/adenine1519-N6)-dimethyltransferase|nr:16S rRNA (adenine(1518)-N(6)/adenine(1519)-N(6))-dimethyltransferase RsmA [Tannerella sp.]